MNIPRPSLAVYLMANEAAPELAEAAVRGGATVIELGIPYSDPLADGTTIQRAAQAALDAGITRHEHSSCSPRSTDASMCHSCR